MNRVLLVGLCVLWAGLTFSQACVEIAFCATFGLWLLWIISKHDFGVLWSESAKAYLVPLYGYMLLVILTSFMTEHPPQTLRGLLKVGQQIAIFFLTADILKTEKNRKTFEFVFLIVFFVVLFDVLVQYFWGQDLIRGFRGVDASAGIRVTGSFKNYGFLAVFLMLTIPVVFMWGYRKPWRIGKWVLPSWLYLFGAACGTVLIYLTRSRGAMLACAAGIVLFVLLARKWKILVGILVLGGLSLLVMPKGMVIHLDIEGKEQSMVERFYLWERALQVIKAKPLTGTGINTYAVSHQKYDKTQSWRVRNYYAHNGYLQMAAETGLPSLFLFLVFVLTFFWRAHQASRRGDPNEALAGLGIALGLVNFLFFAALDTSLHNPLPVMTFWLVAGWQYARLRDVTTTAILS
ncbi:MAG: O-antigen ligase family protein [Candidatus Omnitrophota bacterium]|nr:O-antigen ligase family protein [Candidatus Omnitrophota bacterium]